MSASPPTPVTCSSCGTTTPDPALTGMVEHDRVRGTSWVCGECLRGNVRAVEAKLDRAWW
ncbi:hypothetical protein JL107_11905 [Nakamurella flavida]|uniref:Uncharacterized protein n=1 Tax=Nakamurella flavida TaxID=363630 RepID=A0A938YPT1_9ACTN|nr:hypothetical protein [Nakamurella flavida]MBM9477154.1 hypothetical protein [Nakamurella flavida]MDP9780103.1 hypothetical protein [Nakamurella flavida]